MFYRIGGKTPVKLMGQMITKRCFAIADTHGKHELLGKISGDWFFHSGNLRFLRFALLNEIGDFLGNGTKEELIAFNEWLGKLDFEEKFIVAGKSDLALDPALRRDGDKTKELITNAHYLEDSGINVMG